MAARELSGSGIAGEVADFIAHPVRTKGRVWSDISDAVEFMRFRVEYDNRNVLTNTIPTAALSALRANLRRMRKKTLYSHTQLNKAQASDLLEQIIGRTRQVSSNRSTRLPTNSQLEHNLIVCLFSEIKGGSIFDDSDLFEDLYRSMVRLKVIGPSEKSKLKLAKSKITLFAITKLHNKTLDLGEVGKTTLAIRRDQKNCLGVFAQKQVFQLAGSTFSGIFWIMETSLLTDKHCELGVAPNDRSIFVGDFEAKDERLRLVT